MTPSRRSSQHHVGCKLLAAENPHSVRYRTARTRVLGLRRRKLVVRQRVACDHGTNERTALRESSKPGPYADRSARRDDFLNRTQQKGSWDQLCAACHARPCHGHVSRSSRVSRTMGHAERLFVDIICTRAPNVMMICCLRIKWASSVRPSRARVRGRWSCAGRSPMKEGVNVKAENTRR